MLELRYNGTEITVSLGGQTARVRSYEDAGSEKLFQAVRNLLDLGGITYKTGAFSFNATSTPELHMHVSGPTIRVYTKHIERNLVLVTYNHLAHILKAAGCQV